MSQAVVRQSTVSCLHEGLKCWWMGWTYIQPK